MPLDLTPFRNAIERLDEAIAMAVSQSGNEVVRDGAIQRFEYTYELSHKVLRRFLEEGEPVAEHVRELSFPALIRLASERGLLRNGWDVWNDYRNARNTTSHAYDSVKASAVFSKVSAFRDDARVAARRHRAATRAMTANLDVEPRWQEVVSGLLRDYAPRPCRVWAFGSRVRGRARRFSDLDLAMDAGRRLAFGDTRELAEAFEESPLPWRVDIVDLTSCSEAFRSEVESHAVLLLDLAAEPRSPQT